MYISVQYFEQQDKSGQEVLSQSRQGAAEPRVRQSATSFLKVLVLPPKNSPPLPTTLMYPGLRFHFVHQLPGVEDASIQQE